MQSEEKKEIDCKKNQKILKLQHFLQNNYSPKPALPSSIPISQLIREYLNDDDFRILHQGMFVLSSQEYQKKLELFYQQWLQKTAQKQDIDQFIHYWFDNEPQLQVQYSLFDEIKEESKQVEINAVFKRNKGSDKSTIKIVRPESQLQRDSLDTRESIGSSRQQFTPLQLLKQFFIFYSKKNVESKGDSTFSKYQDYYNTINFPKWMNYVRDMGFLKFKKLLPLQSLKNIFIKYQNNDKCVNFELFYETVSKCLDVVYAGNKQKIQSEGYEMIGVKNLKNFQQKFRAMGLLPPIITKNKPKRPYFNPKLKNIDSQSVISKISIVTKLQPKYISPSNASNMKIKVHKIERLSDVTNSIQALRKNYDANKLKTQQRTHNQLQSSQINKSTNSEKALKDLRLNAKVKQNSRLLEQLMEQQQVDPYLKRYNNRQSVGKYHCLMNRIDERVEKICNKY